MKSAYELAMERLEASDPSASKPLTDEQKQEIADIDQRFKAKIAEREIFLNKQLSEARQKREYGDMEQIEEQIRRERLRLQDECEAAKDKVRNAS